MAGLWAGAGAGQGFYDAMKTYYLDPLNDNVVRSHVLLARLEKNSQDISGNFAYVPIISGRNPAVGSRKDASSSGNIGAKLPGAGAQTYTKATYRMAYHYGRASVSGISNRQSRNDRGAFANSLDTEIQGLMKSLPDDLNRQVCGYGNGRAATLSGTNTVQTTSTLIKCEARDNFSVKVGDRVHFDDITDGGAISPTNGTTVTAITLNGATNEHYVYLAAASGATVTSAVDAMYFGAETSMAAADSSRGKEMLGIRAIVDDGAIGADEQIASEAGEMLDGSVANLGGIARASNAFWQSTVLANGGTARALTQNLLFEAHLYSTAMNGANPADIELYMGVGTWGTLGLVQVGSRVYNDFQETVEYGFSAINVMGSKAFYDRDLKEGEIFYLNMPSIMLLTQGGYEFWDADGNMIRIAAGGNYDALEFTIFRDCQLAANNLRAHTRLKDIKLAMSPTVTIY